MYQQPQLMGMQSAQAPSAFLPKLPMFRSPGQIEEYKYDSVKPKKQLKEIRKVLLPEKKKFLFFRYGKQFNLKDRCVVCGTHHHWDAGDYLRPVIPLTEVHKGRPMRGTYCPKHAAIHMQMEMLEQQILANEHGLEFKGFKPKMPTIIKKTPLTSLSAQDLASLTAAGWSIRPPTPATIEDERAEASALLNDLNASVQRLNHLVEKGVELNGTERRD
jgi:hypothetical protein|tara:strand:+ start:30 stop:680 length:651 start_codon:yes stop_codon:yes gene_type:complete